MPNNNPTESLDGGELVAKVDQPREQLLEASESVEEKQAGNKSSNTIQETVSASVSAELSVPGSPGQWSEDSIFDGLETISIPDEENMQTEASAGDFRMPENFDLPQDLIQEISPRNHINLKPEERLASLGVPVDPFHSSLSERLPDAVVKPSTTLQVPSNNNKMEDDKDRNISPAKRPEKQTQETEKSIKQVIEPATPEPDNITNYYSKDCSSKATKGTKRSVTGDYKRNRKMNNVLFEVFGEGSQESEGNVSSSATGNKRQSSSSKLKSELAESKGMYVLCTFIQGLTFKKEGRGGGLHRRFQPRQLNGL